MHRMKFPTAFAITTFLLALASCSKEKLIDEPCSSITTTIEQGLWLQSTVNSTQLHSETCGNKV